MYRKFLLRVPFFAFVICGAIISCSTLPEPMKERYNIDPLLGEGQYLRIERGRKWIDAIDADVAISCLPLVEDRSGFNYAFKGPTFSFYIGIRNKGLPVIQFDEKNIYVFGKNNSDEKWTALKQYSAEETYQIWKDGKTIMWTHESQMDYLLEAHKLKVYLLYSQSIYAGKAYTGFLKADFVLFDQIKLMITINRGTLEERNVEFIYRLEQDQS
jgi:hypothetical protein